METAAPFILVGGAILLGTGRALDALTLGETGARALGVSLRRTQGMIAVGGSGLACGAAVAVTGVIGFVGLIVPHLVRRMVGEQAEPPPDPKRARGRQPASRHRHPGARHALAPTRCMWGSPWPPWARPFFLALLVSLRRRLA